MTFFIFIYEIYVWCREGLRLYPLYPFSLCYTFSQTRATGGDDIWQRVSGVETLFCKTAVDEQTRKAWLAGWNKLQLTGLIPSSVVSLSGECYTSGFGKLTRMLNFRLCVRMDQQMTRRCFDWCGSKQLSCIYLIFFSEEVRVNFKRSDVGYSIRTVSKPQNIDLRSALKSSSGNGNYFRISIFL